MTRYDYLLAGIAAVLALSAAVGVFTPVSLGPALAGGSALAGVLLADAMFINPPMSTAPAGRDDDREPVRAD